MGEPTEGIAGLVTLKKAAELFGCTPQAIGHRVRRWGLPTVRVGKSLLVSLTALRATYTDAPRVSERA